MQLSAFEQRLIEAALGREALEAQGLLAFGVDHGVQQVATGPDAVARHAVAVDQFAPHGRRVAELFFGEAGRQRAIDTFSWGSIAKQTKALYETLR